MFKPVAPILALITLAGCGVQPVQDVPFVRSVAKSTKAATPAVITVAAAKPVAGGGSLSLTVQAPQKRAYSLQATGATIARVVVTLMQGDKVIGAAADDHPDKAATLRFTGLAAGAYSVYIDVYDSQGMKAGKGSATAQVKAGVDSQVGVNVALGGAAPAVAAPQPVTGNLGINVTFTDAPAAAPPAATPAPVVVPVSNSPEMGAYCGNVWNTGTPALKFGEWLGKPVRVTEEMLSAGAWDQISGDASWQQLDDLAALHKSHPEIRLVLTTGLLAGEGDRSGPTSGPAAHVPVSLEQGAKGDYDAYYVKLAQNLVKRGLGDITIRLGHEFNGYWMIHTSVGHEQAYAGYFHRVVKAMHGVSGCNVKFNWCASINQGQGDGAYPGDDVVDYVGVDTYDTAWQAYPKDGPKTDAMHEAAWKFFKDDAYGLQFWSDFARKHGKQMAVDEWGVWDNDNSGGDDPIYIQHMYNWLNDRANNVAYASYFNVDWTDGGHALTGNTQFPKAAAKYKELFGK